MTEPEKKTALVTGANSGVGLETARGLAAAGFRVILGVRSEEKGRAALDDIRATTKSEALRIHLFDLGDLNGLGDAARTFLAQEDRLDLLINNAGLGTADKNARTEDGLPLTMGVNHIGTYRLTALLLPRLLETARETGEARLVNVSSMAHKIARAFDPRDLVPEKRPPWRNEYAESKLANLLHARELARRHGEDGLRAHAVHPGFVASNFGRAEHFPGPTRLAFTLTKPLQISPEKGAKPSLHAALSEEGGRVPHAYFTEEHQAEPYLPPHAEEVQAALFEETERLIGTKTRGA